MKAVICTKYGPPEVLKIQEVNKPIFKDNEVLVKIISTAVNSGDVRVRGLVADGIMKLIMRLMIGFSKPRKAILGTVYAGVIEDVGINVSKFKKGDKVFGMTAFNFGTHAEYTAVKEKSYISLMPENASFDEAVSLIFGGQTAIYFIDKVRLSEMKSPNVLVIGATGSVGTAAVQIAKFNGAEVTAVCSTKGKDLMEQLGVSNVIFYDLEDFTKQSVQYDFIFDAVGKTDKKQCQALLKENGIYKTVGGFEYASESHEQLEKIKNLYEKGRLKAIIDRKFPLDRIVEAHEYVDTGRKKGNVIINVFES
ncbi:MAG: NAD(P)-dependent alcohol dehydrogenase [Bacteroidetes bacterium]|nr:MAG: NAD(P)-dependent alcohol dehydrogenase [Bacteroidota bacterium]REK05674.1 MAG: NAD(P)-dependent alcohol dehydrogenase [Bacteroidota bacterium]REK32020.1 MAG: NAD(P)-dependent alcohol dehydrogenase [Bacteroidota bacterium]REK50084.1 MAG: NAD(P)-dependent alcohol dehydrogenase [Bacteroidota bacterium]